MFILYYICFIHYHYHDVITVGVGSHSALGFRGTSWHLQAISSCHICWDQLSPNDPLAITPSNKNRDRVLTWLCFFMRSLTDISSLPRSSADKTRKVSTSQASQSSASTKNCQIELKIIWSNINKAFLSIKIFKIRSFESAIQVSIKTNCQYSNSIISRMTQCPPDAPFKRLSQRIPLGANGNSFNNQHFSDWYKLYIHIGAIARDADWVIYFGQIWSEFSILTGFWENTYP